MGLPKLYPYWFYMGPTSDQYGYNLGKPIIAHKMINLLGNIYGTRIMPPDNPWGKPTWGQRMPRGQIMSWPHVGPTKMPILPTLGPHSLPTLTLNLPRWAPVGNVGWVLLFLKHPNSFRTLPPQRSFKFQIFPTRVVVEGSAWIRSNEETRYKMGGRSNNQRHFLYVSITQSCHR